MINTFDELSCEEVFELNEMCDEWLNEAIEAQDKEMQESEKQFLTFAKILIYCFCYEKSTNEFVRRDDGQYVPSGNWY